MLLSGFHMIHTSSIITSATFQPMIPGCAHIMLIGRLNISHANLYCVHSLVMRIAWSVCSLGAAL